MNDTPNTGTNGVEVLRHYYVDADGNEVEIPFDDASDFRDSEAAQQETAFIAEDGVDTPVTVH